MGSPLDDDPYGEAALYDLEYAHHDEDIPWYVAQARRVGGPVLELGCGTGRLLLPIARAGMRIVGIDRAPAMVAALRRKLLAEPPEVRARVDVVEGDYLQVPFGEGVRLVAWPFNALHHCDGPAEVAAVLTRLREAVHPEGRLALDCYLPDLELYDRDPTQRYEPRVFRDPRTGERLHSWEQGWWDAAARVHHVLYVYQHPDGREERAHLRLRMYELPELHAMLAQTGWAVVREAQDFEGSPVDDRALKWVALLRPAG